MLQHSPICLPPSLTTILNEKYITYKAVDCHFCPLVLCQPCCLPAQGQEVLEVAVVAAFHQPVHAAHQVLGDLAAQVVPVHLREVFSMFTKNSQANCRQSPDFPKSLEPVMAVCLAALKALQHYFVNNTIHHFIRKISAHADWGPRSRVCAHPPLGPQSTLVEIFRRTWLQNRLQTSFPTA